MSSMNDLRAKCEAAATNLTNQLEGMDRHLDRADAPGEWTTREVLCHLLFAPGFDPVALLGTFSASNLPLVEITPGVTEVTPERKGQSLRELHDALQAQRPGSGAQGAHPDLQAAAGHRGDLHPGVRGRHVRLPLEHARRAGRKDPRGGGAAGGGLRRIERQRAEAMPSRTAVSASGAVTLGLWLASIST